MSRGTQGGFVLAVCLALVPNEAVHAQISPASMQSGCTNVAAGAGLIEGSLYFVPQGSTFVLTDFSFSPTGYAAAPVVPGGANPEWNVSLWLRNWVQNSDVRWVTGGIWHSGDQNWPVQKTWSTGIVFAQNEIVRFGISGGPGGAYPAATICWSGYLVPTTTSSVIPGDDGRLLALRASPNPLGEDVVLRLELAKRQSVEIGVFTVEGRRVRILHRGTMDAGSHQLAWDGRDEAGTPVADGIYFARLKTPQGSRTTRLARIR